MITEKQWNILLEALGRGLNRSDACILSGISRESFYNRLESDFVFKEKVEKMELKLKTEALENIVRQSAKNWTASAWLLERKYKDEYSVKQQIEHSGEFKANLSLKDFRQSYENTNDASGKTNPETSK